jgi:hypothetical protein
VLIDGPVTFTFGTFAATFAEDPTGPPNTPKPYRRARVSKSRAIIAVSIQHHLLHRNSSPLLEV